MPGKARIDAIDVENTTKGVTYKVYPAGEVPKADAGDSLTLWVTQTNVGDETDNLWVEWYVGSRHLGPSGTMDVPPGATTKGGRGYTMEAPPVSATLIVYHGSLPDLVEDERKEFTIEPYTLTHTLTVESTPISVPVTLNGSSIGNTPVSATVEEGMHNVEVPSEVEV